MLNPLACHFLPMSFRYACFAYGGLREAGLRLLFGVIWRTAGQAVVRKIGGSKSKFAL